MPLALHLTGMFGCTLISFLAFPRWRWWLRGLLMLALGVGIEFGQGWQPSRTVDQQDIIANSAGVLVGLIVIAILRRVLSAHSERRNQTQR